MLIPDITKQGAYIDQDTGNFTDELGSPINQTQYKKLSNIDQSNSLGSKGLGFQATLDNLNPPSIPSDVTVPITQSSMNTNYVPSAKGTGWNLLPKMSDIKDTTNNVGNTLEKNLPNIVATVSELAFPETIPVWASVLAKGAIQGGTRAGENVGENLYKHKSWNNDILKNVGNQTAMGAGSSVINSMMGALGNKIYDPTTKAEAEMARKLAPAKGFPVIGPLVRKILGTPEGSSSTVVGPETNKVIEDIANNTDFSVSPEGNATFHDSLGNETPFDINHSGDVDEILSRVQKVLKLHNSSPQDIMQADVPDLIPFQNAVRAAQFRKTLPIRGTNEGNASVQTSSAATGLLQALLNGNKTQNNKQNKKRK